MNKTMLFSFIRIFVSAMIAQYISLGRDIFDIDSEGWKSIVGAGSAALILVLYNTLNPNDPRYGKQSTKSTEIVDK